MRPLAATLATTGLPLFVGLRWVAGPRALRFGMGGLLGVAFLGIGALLGGLVGAVLPGAALVLTLAYVLGPRWRFVLDGEDAVGPTARRLVVAVLVVGAVLLLLAVWRPVAWWDGWMIWSLKAKALAATGDFSGPVFTNPVYGTSHPDYPPLLSCWQAVAYLLQGTSEVSWPLQVQLAFLWTMGGLTLVSLASRWGTGAVLIFGAWVFAPHLVRQMLSGYADVPMAMFLVAGAAALWIGPRGGSMAPAGVLLGAGALTKNEGLPLALLVLIPLLFSAEFRSRALRVGAVLIVAYLPWGIFVRVRGFANDLASAVGDDPVGPGTILARVPVVAFELSRELLWPLRWALLTLACVAVIALTRRVCAPLAATTLGSLGLFSVIYVTAAVDFDFLVEFSVDRVVTTPLGFLALAAAWSLRPVGLTEPSGLDASVETGHPTRPRERLLR